jgi:glycosyltransferase involved in cell wall biosynthesis
MHIVMLLNSTYPKPLDIRVRKEYSSLVKSGFKVTLVCLQGDEQPATELYEGVHIRRIQAGKTVYHLAFWDVVMSLTFVHPVFHNALKKLSKTEHFDAIHVHDLPLVGTALSFRNIKTVKVVFDMHENYAEALKIWFQWKTNILAKIKNKLFLRPSLWLQYEARALREADHVLAVVDEMKKRIVETHQISEHKITVISNTEPIEFTHQAIDDIVYKNYKNKFIVTYTGAIGPHRGVDTVIESFQFLKTFKEIVFIVVGSGSSDVMNSLRQLIQKHHLEDQVFLEGHKPFHQVYSYMKLADVNIIPHKINEQNEHVVPHKLFQSMLATKPLLVSSSTPLNRIVTETGAGRVFIAENPSSCAEKILEFYKNPSESLKMGEAGFIAATGKYSWEATGAELVKVYQNL